MYLYLSSQGVTLSDSLRCREQGLATMMNDATVADVLNTHGFKNKIVLDACSKIPASLFDDDESSFESTLKNVSCFAARHYDDIKKIFEVHGDGNIVPYDTSYLKNNVVSDVETDGNWKNGPHVAKFISMLTSTLNPREEATLRLLFGIKPLRERLDYEDIAKKFGVTEFRIKQISDKAISKLSACQKEALDVISTAREQQWEILENDDGVVSSDGLAKRIKKLDPIFVLALAATRRTPLEWIAQYATPRDGRWFGPDDDIDMIRTVPVM